MKEVGGGREKRKDERCLNVLGAGGKNGSRDGEIEGVTWLLH